MDYKKIKVYDQEAVKITEGLRLADCMNLGFEEYSEKIDDNSFIYNLKELAVSDVLTCSYCNVTFTDGLDQRNHYKLDWHRYNLKRALSGNQSVPEEIFNSLRDDVSSISGSDGETSTEESDTDVEESLSQAPSENFSNKLKSVRHAKAFFKNNENKILSVYRCLLHSKKETLMKEDLVKNASELIAKPIKWMIVMLGGGHFAAAVFENENIVCHKTFHCYTVRAKQGGSQTTRDNKGGNHPKSAGASLRRYNEQALVQHVQEIMGTWCEVIKQCSLILYRAPGPYNRGVLFGGKNPLLSKKDNRLRNIPFPTRRATFKEVKRIFDLLSSIEIYGSAEEFKDNFPRSPDKRTWSPKTKQVATLEETEQSLPSSQEKNRSKERASPTRELPGKDIQSSLESSSEESNYELIAEEVTLSFQSLQEYEDTVPQEVKDMRKANKKKKKKKKLGKKQKDNTGKKEWNEEFERIQENLVNSCKNENQDLLVQSLAIYDTLPQKETLREEEEEDIKKPNWIFTKEDFIDCLNAPVEEEHKNTLLHLAAKKCLPDFVTLLLTAGADPAVRNKSKLTPYLLAGNKETRNSFRSFVGLFPDKYDLKKANIPEPLTKEQEIELEEKKKEKKKLKRIKEKKKKQENMEKKQEEIEKTTFLALSDREKCALAAERRLIASSTVGLKSKSPKLFRCFQCGVDISGKVPFEYGPYRFCTIPCLKDHRQKTKNYAVEI